MSFSVLIELLENCVLNAHSATEAQHDTLKVIPGSALLGIAAHSLYHSLCRSEADRLFHSGAVKFGDGFPLSKCGDIGYPMPYALHYPKRGQMTQSNAEKVCIGPDVINGVHRPLHDGDTQFVQMRSDFVTGSGEVIRVRSHAITKTAIEKGEMRAKVAQLFSYHALDAGQKFIAKIETPTGFDDKALQAAFTGERLLGRSRSAEFGRVQLKIIENMAPLPSTEPEAHMLTMWCVSHLALADEWGFPKLTPDAQSMGINGLTFLPEKSFLRTLRLSGYNAQRQAFDPERQVIARGSVLCFQSTLPITTPPSWLGLHQELGYGYIWVNPPPLSQSAFLPDNARSDKICSEISAPTTTSSPLIAWMREQAASKPLNIHSRLKPLLEELKGNYQRAKQEPRSDASGRANPGPSKSQWNAVAEIARSKSKPQEATTALCSGNGPCKPNGRGWADKFYVPSQTAECGRLESFYEWFCQRVLSGDSVDLSLLRQFAREAVRIAEESEETR